VICDYDVRGQEGGMAEERREREEKKKKVDGRW